jgi:hypothetical protein
MRSGKRPLTYISTALVVALLVIAGVLGSSAQASPQSPQAKRADLQSAIKKIASVKSPALTLEDTIEALGQSSYADSYGGLTVTQSGPETAAPSHITVYLVRSAAQTARYVAAIGDHAVVGSASKYSVVYVSHSWAQLNALTMKIESQRARWQTKGIDLERWGPDAASNRVIINLKSYSQAAARSLLASYGAKWISVSHQSLNLNLRLDQRNDDFAPFYGGDPIYVSTPQSDCTSGFVMLGSINPNNHWVLTAGHCGIEPAWNTNLLSGPNLIGPTATEYWNGAGGGYPYDVQTIGPAFAWGDVYGNTTVYEPYTTLTPGTGQLITFDGSVAGEVNDVPVTRGGPFCQQITGISICGLGEALGSTPICRPGDSGGPVFQRTSTADKVQAVGLIEASTNDYKDCYYTLINSITAITHTKLDTNPEG